MKKLPVDRQFAMQVLFTGHGPATFKGHNHDLSQASLPELMLENAEMPGVILDGANLQKAWLKGSNLYGARMVLADLHEAELSGADLRNCKLNNANLINANLRGADLRGADLTRTKLQGAQLNDAQIDGAEQLAYVASLYEASGLTDDMRSVLKEHNPMLFRKPPDPEDDPDNFMLAPSSPGS